MELGNQMKRYRSELKLSQETLAERLYVSRQTISNWENDKSYPDINSLLRMSEIFAVSLDELLKGDVEKMREEVTMEERKEERREFEILSGILAVLMIAAIISPIPLVHFLSWAGIVIWVLLMAAAFYVAILVEKKKKKFNIQTYREILAFEEGRSLDRLDAVREEAKRPYQKILLMIAAGLVALAVSALMMYVLR